jgi:hypothetical protein
LRPDVRSRSRFATDALGELRSPANRARVTI